MGAASRGKARIERDPHRAVAAESWNAVLIGVGIAGLAAAVYLNALGNGLVWDDPIVLQRQLLAFKSLHDLIFIPRNIPQYSPDYYRPLTELSYLLDRAIAGTGPFMFHLSVVLFHVITTYLVFRFGLRVFRATPVALLAAGLGAALFAVHPIHTESVAWGAGRSDVLACCLALGGMLVYLEERWSSLGRATLSALLVFLGMLAKETAFAVLLLLPVADMLLRPRAPVPSRNRGTRAARRRERGRKPVGGPQIGRYVPLLIAAAIYFALRQAALGTIFGRGSRFDLALVLKIIGATGLYMSKLLLPIHQSAYISLLPSGGPILLLICGVLIALAGATFLSWRRQERAVTFLLLWTGVTLAPSLAIVAKIPAAPVAERYLYFPSVGFCLLVGYGAARLIGWLRSGAARNLVYAIVALILITAAVATVRRNSVWRSNLSLWADTAKKNTLDGLPMRSLAAAYLEAGDVARAAKDFHLALQRRNDMIGRLNIYNNLGSLAMQEKKIDLAESYYKTALSIDPNAPDALYNMALIALTRATQTDASRAPGSRHEQAERARRLFSHAAQLSPLDPEIQVGLGQTLTILGDSEGARTHYQRALQLGLPSSMAAAVRKRLAALD